MNGFDRMLKVDKGFGDELKRLLGFNIGGFRIMYKADLHGGTSSSVNIDSATE